MTGYPIAHITPAKQMRREPTEAERLLWARLRSRQIDGQKFRRQQPIGGYIVDFLCAEKRLIVEADGSQHQDSATDERRDQFLNDAGYSVLRFWNHDILSNPEGVFDAIRLALGAAPSPSHRFRDGPLPLPQGERDLTMEHNRG